MRWLLMALLSAMSVLSNGCFAARYPIAQQSGGQLKLL